MIPSNYSRCRPVFLLVLLLAISSSFYWRLQNDFLCRQTKTNNNGYLQQFVPERLRSFVAARFWAKADELMHRGPFPGSRQSYTAGSYFGNSDIVPLLQVVINMMPEELAPYQLQARCLASLESGDAGLRVLQQGIMNNRSHAALHELYAAAAHLKLFSGKKPDQDAVRSAAKYIEQAVRLFDEASLKLSSDPTYNSMAYHILLARIYLELAQPEKALQSWLKSGQDLDNSQDRLAEVLRYYRDHGFLPEARFPQFLSTAVDPAAGDSSQPDSELESETQQHAHHQDGEHSDCNLCSTHGSQKQKTLPGLPLARLFLAGFMLVLALMLSRVRARG